MKFRLQLAAAVFTGIILGSGLSSILWWNETKQLKLQFDQSRAESDNTISALENKIRDAGESYHALLANLEEARMIGQQTMQQVAEEQTRYEQLLDEFELVKNDIPAIHKQYEIDLSRLQRARDFLAIQNESLKQDIYQLQEQSTQTGDLYQEEKLQMSNQLEKLKAQSINLQSEVQRYKNELQQYQQLLVQLKNENDEYENIVNSLQDNKPTPGVSQTKTLTVITPEPPVEASEKDRYRQTRLESLNKALQNRSSDERRQILINVIPTIPQGISAEELVTFSNDMSSTDLLSVIRETGKFLIRPLNKQAIETVLAKLDKKDAETAKSFLYKGN